MASSPVEILKQRLANGEITISEYQQILAHLNLPSAPSISLASTKDALQHGAAAAGKASLKLFDTVFGSNSYSIPTDSNPLEITGNFTIYGTFFIFKTERFIISEIKSIGFKAFSQKINLIPAAQTSELHIVMNNNKKIDVSGVSMFVTGGRNKKLNAAYEFLSKKSFEIRYKRYVSELNLKGYIEIDKVKITKDGNLLKGSSSINLRVSAKKGFMGLGTTYGWGSNNSSNPYEVLAGESGIGVLSDRIRFEVIYDRDVIFDVLRQLSGLEE